MTFFMAKFVDEHLTQIIIFIVPLQTS